uniref:PB1 domain-containing protein n=1 Tax=Aegilops tauschii TaxID=37682 RepID=M8BQM1_AEGTA
MELRFAFLVHIRRDRYMLNAKNKKKFQGGFDYPLPMACNWSFRQFGEVICSQYPWGLLDEVEYKYYDGEKKWVTVSNDEELATMFARHKDKENFRVRLQIDVPEQAFGPRMAGATSRAEPSRCNGSSSENSSVSARRRGGSTSMGTGSRNLRRAPRAENQDEAHNAARVDDDAVGEDEDLAAVEWDPDTSILHHAFISIFIALWAVITHYVTILMPILSYFARFT